MCPDVPTLQSDWALFLDIDGTLIDLAARPDLVEVPQDLRALLTELDDALGGAVALVSGRSLAVIDELFAPLHLPAAGQHGAELRLGSDRVRMPRDPHLAAIAMTFADFAAAHPGVLVEDKGDSIAVHYRGAPQCGEEARALAQSLIEAAGDSLELMLSNMAVDIKSRAVSKGSAIEWFMDRPPFHDRVPAFLGDDRTDEDGFAVVNERGGYSFHVGNREDSAARFHLRSPAEVRRWLGKLASRDARTRA